ncbi:SDR family NAD(P)-dependent oxidoreductase [Nocardioides limicola]|uniref:SDR family NAD(P)-dependent oxidoreductase n=1 Tax=Nocardioides limicola TaxID=2803368 RepID=UPI00193BAA6F|nr:SDR family NAD(P)-dependent oxidoreductase [Nocardioides sp. DJM-14]
MTLLPPTVDDLLDLTGRTAIVTGGALGIGRGIVERLAAGGASVVIADTDLATAQALADTVMAEGHQALASHCDVSDEDDVHRLIADAIGWRGRIDILVNNAGIFPVVNVLEMSAADFDRVIAVNLRGAFLCSREAAKRMRDGGGGRIINITSIDALHPSMTGLAHYDASKHGLWGFTKNLALELAPHRIWVNAIAPGAIATPGVAAMQEPGNEQPNDTLEQFVNSIPMHRIGTPDDIARVALFLASDLSSYLTGSQIVVDGGALLT